MSDSDGSASIGTRWPETAVALLLLALGALVIADSLRVGIGWADDGPRSGYFPFYIGLGLVLSSASVLFGVVRRWRQADEAFAEKSQLALVIAVLVPIAVYVFGVATLGIYLASLLLIAYFMKRHGRYGFAATASVSIGVPVFFFLVFERWFLVPLPKGFIERALGF
ncbi:MAG TPA: tripartite tricarboxylate transporter TctB family protein [Methylibium sp.]|uniref:tripartite tricarboxylate transporter TctB family protein n=1 Tax=Methylibium sp. TaxID=2067992 RepID=UPI002DBC9525|nr:tripartite tricarboxylate transporter TctB family protein [Methylibium sp.]HEU4457711.1 tripartite tricarboxylate transporter TctB family protein [Methylibium sp.]